jgi:hypothetical protein
MEGMVGPIERFTRDAVSKYVWSSLLLAAILGLVFAMLWGDRAVEAELRASETRAVTAVREQLAPRIQATDLTAPFTGAELASLREVADRSILNDPRMVRVRIWSAGGLSLFSTDRHDALGSNAAFNNEVLAEAASGETLTRSNVTDIGGEDALGRSLLRTYTPIGRGAVAEVDQTTAGTIAPIHTEWAWYQVLAGAVIVLFLVLTFFSLRDPVERINAGVHFAPSAIPAGYALIDNDRLHAVEEVYRLAHDRVARLERKLAESEAMRRRLEGDIQRALTQAATGSGARAASTLPTALPAPAAAARHPAPQPAGSTPGVARPAASAARSSSGELGAAARRRARRAAAEKPPPSTTDVVTVPESEVVGGAETPRVTRIPRAVRDDAGKRSIPAAASVSSDQAPTTRRRRREESRSTPPVAIPSGEGSEPPGRSSRPRRRGEPGVGTVVAPRAQPDIDEAKAHEAALETFIRLTESDRRHEDASQVDQGAIRAALARTAARKKPGGDRLQPHEDPHEGSPGGPRVRR